jgi:hypothetical protein
MVSTMWSEIMEQVLGALKNEKISAGILVLMVALAWYVHAWAEEEFVKQSEFSQLQTTVSTGFESIEINDAGQIIRDIKLELIITKATQGSEADLDRLTDKLEHAQAYKQCLVERKPNCKHLKDVE